MNELMNNLYVLTNSLLEKEILHYIKEEQCFLRGL